MACMSKLGDRIREAREARDWSQHELARRAGVSQPIINRLERGQTITSKHLPTILQVLELNNEKFLVIPLVGHVGAGAEIFPMDTIGEVEAPPGYWTPQSVAVVVRGDSMRPAYRDGDIIYYDEHLPPHELVGREVVVELEDGRCLVKELYVGSKPDTWMLHSHNAAPMEARIKWAARIRWVQRA